MSANWSPLRGEWTAGAWAGPARREPAAARPPGGAPAASPDPWAPFSARVVGLRWLWDAEIQSERKQPYHLSLPKYIYVHLHRLDRVFQHLPCFPDCLRDLLNWLGNRDGTLVPRAPFMSSAVTLFTGCTAKEVSVSLFIRLMTSTSYIALCLKNAHSQAELGFQAFQSPWLKPSGQD